MSLEQQALRRELQHRLNGSGGDAQEPLLTKLPYLDWLSLNSQEPPPRKWFVTDWLTTGATLLAGGGGMGKTLIAQSIATALATAPRNFVGSIGANAVSLMWACEDDSDELWRRQRAICSALGVSMPALEDQFYLVPRYGCDNALYALASGRPVWTDLLGVLREQVRYTCCDVLWLDNIAHVFGAEENNRHHVTAFVNGLQALSSKPMSVVLLGHPAKAAGSEYSGTTAWENAVRTRWYLGSKLPGENGEGAPDDDTVRYLCRRKANYSSRDYCRLTYANGVLVPDALAGASFSSRYGAQERAADAERVMLDGFDRCVQSGITPSDSRNAQDYLPKKLLAMGLHGGHSKQDLANAMNKLMASGALVRGVVGQYGNRAPKQGLIRP